MSAEIDAPIPDPFADAGGLTRGRFTYFPVVPGRLEFAIEVRAAILRLRPQVIAVELPVTLQASWMRAVERLPQIFIDFPERDEEYQILKENLPFAEDRILNYVVDFLQMAHAADERYTVRDGINVARYAIKLKSLATQRTHESEALEIAIVRVLGEEALRYVRRNRHADS